MWLWLVAVFGGLWLRHDRVRGFEGRGTVTVCDGLSRQAVRKVPSGPGRIMGRRVPCVLSAPGQAAWWKAVSLRWREGDGDVRRGDALIGRRMRGLERAEFGYFCQDEAAGAVLCEADHAACSGRCDAAGAGPDETAVAGVWRRGVQSAQSGLRFSRKAVMPSSVSRQSMFSTIVAPVRA